jgi:hypothetical protein
MRLKKARYWSLFLISIATSAVCFAAGEENIPTNGDIFSRLCAEATDSIAMLLPATDSSAISVVFDADSATHTFQYVILEELKKRVHSVFLRESNVDAIVSLTVSQVSVQYENPFSESFLGTRKATRKAELQMRGTVSNASNHQVMWAGTIERSYTDTIPISQIASLESSSRTIAQGIVPEAPFMERLVEPMVIIAATGIAVYLFFTIRS